MTLNKIKRLEELDAETKRLRAEIQTEQANCNHDFTKLKYDPTEKTNWEFSHFTGHGSDPEPHYVTAGTTKEPRWTRTCKLCGKIEHTTKRRTTETEPDFK